MEVGRPQEFNHFQTSVFILVQRFVQFVNKFLQPTSLQVLHYAQELFEGMKAYRGVDGKIRLFRPMHNMARMNLTASRACLPAFDGHEFLECIRKYVMVTKCIWPDVVNDTLLWESEEMIVDQS